MGFAALPGELKLGVYMLKKTGDLIYISRNVYIWHSEVWYKKGQRNPRVIFQGNLRLYFEYLGEL
jgi:hypothetical protein